MPGRKRPLRSGRSLLSIGVVAVEGDFRRGDAVLIKIGRARIWRGTDGLSGHGRPQDHGA